MNIPIEKMRDRGILDIEFMEILAINSTEKPCWPQNRRYRLGERLSKSGAETLRKDDPHQPTDVFALSYSLRNDSLMVHMNNVFALLSLLHI